MNPFAYICFIMTTSRKKADPYDRSNRVFRTKTMSEAKSAKYIAVMKDLNIVSRPALVNLALEEYAKKILPNYEVG